MHIKRKIPLIGVLSILLSLGVAIPVYATDEGAGSNINSSGTPSAGCIFYRTVRDNLLDNANFICKIVGFDSFACQMADLEYQTWLSIIPEECRDVA